MSRSPGTTRAGAKPGTKPGTSAGPSAGPSGKPPARAGGRQEVRLIGGSLRGRKLPVLDRPGLRPTPDRVRETLFNWLGQDLSGWRVLDAFAGSGALGFEAASRGAAQVLLLERDAALASQLKAQQQRLAAAALQVLAVDAMSWMARAPAAAFELVLLDPPFHAGLAEPALQQALRLLVPGGWLYLETGQALDPLPAGLRLHRQLRAGAVCAQLLQVD